MNDRPATSPNRWSRTAGGRCALSLVALLVAGSWMPGCASDKPSQTAGDSPASADHASERTAQRHDQTPVRPTAEIVRDLLVGTNNGLEVRRWTVLDPADRTLSVIAERADGSAVEPAASERLRQNGIRFARVPLDQLDAIIETLGGATMDRNEWHGQVYDWRSMREQPIDSRGTAIAIDGRVRRFDRGEFRLLMRGWTVMMEDGPHLHVELLPQHRLPSANNLSRLLTEKPQDAGEAFASMALDLQLQAGFAYVLVSESPTIDWPQLDAPSPDVRANGNRQTEAAAPAPSAADSAAPIAVRPRVGPDDAVGPEAGAPRTLGEVLLPTMRSPPMREVIVLVPRIPPELFPPVYASDGGARPAREAEQGDGTRREEGRR